jgi:uncharacterized protein YndB with AHSA1/START domain
MLKFVALAVLIAMVALLVLAMRQPDTFRVSRSRVIKAPADRLYAEIVDFSRWAAWSPYERLDPAMHRSISGPSNGVGAAYEWSGNGKVGRGQMRITDAAASRSVSIALLMTKPMAADNRVTFTLLERSTGTEVTWTMEGKTPLVGKIMHVLFNFDKMVGGQFDDGLSNLERVSASAAAAADGAKAAAAHS